MDNLTFNQRYSIDTVNKKRALLNDDGSVTTIRSIGIEHDGKEYNVPSYDNDTGTVLSPKAAKKKFMYAIKSGLLQAFNTPDEATAAAIAEHEQVANYAKSRNLQPKDYVGFGPMRDITSLKSILGNR